MLQLQQRLQQILWGNLDLGEPSDDGRDFVPTAYLHVDNPEEKDMNVEEAAFFG